MTYCVELDASYYISHREDIQEWLNTHKAKVTCVLHAGDDVCHQLVDMRYDGSKLICMPSVTVQRDWVEDVRFANNDSPGEYENPVAKIIFDDPAMATLFKLTTHPL